MDIEKLTAYCWACAKRRAARKSDVGELAQDLLSLAWESQVSEDDKLGFVIRLAFRALGRAGCWTPDGYLPLSQSNPRAARRKTKLSEMSIEDALISMNHDKRVASPMYSKGMTTDMLVNLLDLQESPVEGERELAGEFIAECW